MRSDILLPILVALSGAGLVGCGDAQTPTQQAGSEDERSLSDELSGQSEIEGSSKSSNQSGGADAVGINANESEANQALYSASSTSREARKIEFTDSFRLSGIVPDTDEVEHN